MIAAPLSAALARRAGILCSGITFRRFVAARLGITAPAEVTAQAAAEYLRRVCQIASRRELDSDPVAARRFECLLTEFDQWRGRISHSERT